MRHNRKELDSLIEHLNRFLPGSYAIDRNIVGYRLTDGNGSRDISPRLKLGELIQWIHAFKEGYWLAFDNSELGERIPCNLQEECTK